MGIDRWVDSISIRSTAAIPSAPDHQAPSLRRVPGRQPAACHRATSPVNNLLESATPTNERSFRG